MENIVGKIAQNRSSVFLLEKLNTDQRHLRVKMPLCRSHSALSRLWIDFAVIPNFTFSKIRNDSYACSLEAHRGAIKPQLVEQIATDSIQHAQEINISQVNATLQCLI